MPIPSVAAAERSAARAHVERGKVWAILGHAAVDGPRLLKGRASPARKGARHEGPLVWIGRGALEPREEMPAVMLGTVVAKGASPGAARGHERIGNVSWV